MSILQNVRYCELTLGGCSGPDHDHKDHRENLRGGIHLYDREGTDIELEFRISYIFYFSCKRVNTNTPSYILLLIVHRVPIFSLGN